MTSHRALLVAVLACAMVVWISGPAGRLVIALPLLLFVPGYLIARPLLRDAAIPPLALPTVWIGLSLSLLALLYQWAAALEIALPPLVLQALAAAAAAGSVWRGWQSEQEPRAFVAAQSTIFNIRWLLVLGIVLALTVWTRAEHIRDLAAPAWVDSLHHALLARVAAEQGHAPYDLAPYLPVAHLTYHSGYHAFVAALLHIAGAEIPGDIPRALLWSGQAINALQALAWAGAAAALLRRPAAASVAALIVGLVSIMPAFYVSWGRYTLLAGTLVLPAVIVATLALWRGSGRGSLVACALLLAGLSLIHFVVLCFALCWCVTLALARWQRGALMRLGTSGALALALTGPWLLLLLGEVRLGGGASAMSVVGNAAYNALPIELLWTGNNRLLVALAGIGALLGLLRRSSGVSVVVVWCLLAVLLANPVLGGLPYLSFVTNESLVITMYGPLSLLIAAGAALLDSRLTAVLDDGGTRPSPPPLRHPLSLVRERGQGVRAFLRVHAFPFAIAALAMWSAWELRAVVRPDTVLATAADLRAISWAAEQTPADARFVVGTTGWLYAVSRGDDGGWWLLPLARRQVSTPPVVYSYGPDDYVAQVQRETGALRDGAGRDPAALAHFMRDSGYSHVYATSRSTTLNREGLRASPLFAEIYHADDVSIFRLKHQVSIR